MRLTPYPVVILCGGEGTRLYPVTNEIPKSMVEVAGQPFINHQLDLLIEKGVTDVYLLVGKFGEMIQKHIGNTYRNIMDVTYCYDQACSSNGTGSALINAFLILPNEFILLYGDVYPDFVFPDVMLRDPLIRPILMTVYRNAGKGQASNIQMMGNEISKYDKHPPNPQKAAGLDYVDCGLTYVNKSCLCYRITPDFSDTIAELVTEKKVWTFEIPNKPLHIGDPMALAETERYIYAREESHDKD
jgi:N-acetyl-alpha-D-muramate 1-phosphate uridylyltransferase